MKKELKIEEQKPSKEEMESTVFSVEENNADSEELLQNKIDSIDEQLIEKEIEKNEIDSYLQKDHKLPTLFSDMIDFTHLEVLGRDDLMDNDSIDEPMEVEALYFDFENNCFDDGQIQTLPYCYLSNKKGLIMCENNGVYVDKKYFSVAKLFLANKEQLKDLNYFHVFDKIIDFTLHQYSVSSKISTFCMIPESIDAFNTRLRKMQRNMISVPKSVAILYNYLDDLEENEKYYVIDLDGKTPVVTRLSIEQNKMIIREGLVPYLDIKYTCVNFYREYLKQFAIKYRVKFTDNEEDRLVNNKELSIIFQKKSTKILIFQKEQAIILFFDKDIYNQCINRFFKRQLKDSKISKTFVSSSFLDNNCRFGTKKVTPKIAFLGLKKIREVLKNDPNAVVWKEGLPKISLEVIDENKEIFTYLDLIGENSYQNIRLISVNDIITLPFEKTIILKKGQQKVYLPLQREIFSEDINSEKEAYFYIDEKNFPIERDLKVDLSVTYNYLSSSPITLSIKTHDKEASPQFQVSNTWEEPHLIEKISPPIYQERKQVIIQDDWLERCINSTYEAINMFINGKIVMKPLDRKFKENKVGMEYHIDYEFLIFKYKQIRELFDSRNVGNKSFKKIYCKANVDILWNEMWNAIEAYDNNKLDYGEYGLKTYFRGILIAMSDMIVSSYYLAKRYFFNCDNISRIYQYLSEKDNFEILSKLSRCILRKEDDVYGVFEKITKYLFDKVQQLKELKELKYKSKSYEYKDKYNEIIRCIRNLSSNCWFNEEWIFNFYNTQNGPVLVKEIINIIANYLNDKENYGESKKYRDLLEFLVCLSRLNVKEPSILNPNNSQTKKILKQLKYDFLEYEKKMSSSNLQSRLEIEQDKLQGYPNYIYILIMALSGEEQVNLMGYRDD